MDMCIAGQQYIHGKEFNSKRRSHCSSPEVAIRNFQVFTLHMAVSPPIADHVLNDLTGRVRLQSWFRQQGVSSVGV